MHKVTCVYVSNRQMYAETGRWEDVLGYSWVWAVISWPLNWSRCSAGNPRGPSQIWLARSPQPADDKNCSSRRANLHRMLLCIYIYIYYIYIYNSIYKLTGCVKAASLRAMKHAETGQAGTGRAVSMRVGLAELFSSLWGQQWLRWWIHHCCKSPAGGQIGSNPPWEEDTWQENDEPVGSSVWNLYCIALCLCERVLMNILHIFLYRRRGSRISSDKQNIFKKSLKNMDKH